MIERVSKSTNLNLNDLIENGEYTKRAYVLSVRGDLSRFEKGFFTFYLKDENGCVVAGRKFDIKDFIETGYEASTLKGKMVDVEFKAQKYNGSWSFIIYSIKPSANAGDFERFLGKIDVTKDVAYAERLYSEIYGTEWKFPENWKHLSFSSIGQGRCGCVARVFVNVSKALWCYKDLPSVDTRMLLKFFETSFTQYVKYVQQKENLNIVSVTSAIDLLIETRRLYQEDYTELALDVTSAMLGLDKPKHLYSHLINSELENQIRALDLIFTNSALSAGGSSYVRGVNLLRY